MRAQPVVSVVSFRTAAKSGRLVELIHCAIKKLDAHIAELASNL
ncbi:MAG: hypothetical protein WCT12_06790 [Verrucomicrobiota bacterium]